MTTPKEPKGSRAFKDDSGILKSEKYQQMNLIQEITFDWIVDYATRIGCMPSSSQVRVNVLFNAERARTVILALSDNGYLETSQIDDVLRIDGIGPLAPETKTRVVFGHVFVGPVRRRMKIDEAKRLGVELYNVEG